jgi:hypothetical protein
VAAHQHFGVARRIVLHLAHGLAERPTLGDQSHCWWELSLSLALGYAAGGAAPTLAAPASPCASPATMVGAW